MGIFKEAENFYVGSRVLRIHRIDGRPKFAGALTLQKEKDALTFMCLLNLSSSWFSVTWMRDEISPTPYFYLSSLLRSFLLKDEKKNETNTTAFLLFSSISTLICKDKKPTDFGVITNRREPKARREFRESESEQVRIFGTLFAMQLGFLCIFFANSELSDGSANSEI